MGRKKKQQQPAKQQTSSIGYTGNITVSVQAGNKIISKKTYHNNGSKALFKFLVTCIRGDYATANSMRPFYIKLFEVIDGSTPKQIREYLNNGDGWVSDNSNPNFDSSKILLASSEVSYNKTATIGDDESSVTLHFRIPYAYIFQEKIHMACLYGKNSHGDRNWSAYYLLTDAGTATETSETSIENWTALEISPTKNYNLLIDWTMSISNI